MDVNADPPQPAPISIKLVQDPPASVAEESIPPPPTETPAKRDAFYKYWDRFMSEKPNGKTTKAYIANKPKGQTPVPSLDRDVEGRSAHNLRRNTQGQVSTQQANTSYDEAAANCRAKVRAIVNECKRLNVKYTDRNFMLPYPDALNSLDSEYPDSLDALSGIGSVKRVEEIYEKPQFIVDGATANDIRQGSVGDCWFLAAITALSGKKDLIERVCVDRDEKVGVYGFVFFRDGEWISEIVDDKLALRRSDDQRQFPTEYFLSVLGNTDVWREGINKDMVRGVDYDIMRLSKEYKESLRKGSNSLYFASCRESDETWLPLLEKAYAKVHGDYQAISGGFAGEGIEDLTGGVSTYFTSEGVLDKDKLWTELMQVNETSGFLFGCGSRTGRDSDPTDDEGFVRGHAYTVLDTREIKDPKDSNKQLRLLKIRNPWGSTEWNGAWSDGSKEWTAETMTELKHTFGDDGIFWMAFADWLKYFPDFERTRLFGAEWTIAQQWTSVNVPWNTEYLDTKFDISLERAGPVVLVLSQPDSRYFSGLRGRHRHSLHFRLYKKGEDTYLVRSLLETGSGRSCSAELELEPGEYTVFVKIETWRFEDVNTAEEVIKQYRSARRDKLLTTGRSFDLAHSKGRLHDLEDANTKQEKQTQQREDKDEFKRRRTANKTERLRERARRKRAEAERKRKREAKKAVMLEEREAAKARRELARKTKGKAPDAAPDTASATVTETQSDKLASASVDNAAPSIENKPKAEAEAGTANTAPNSTESIVVSKAQQDPVVPSSKMAEEPLTTETVPQAMTEPSQPPNGIEAEKSGQTTALEDPKVDEEALANVANATEAAVEADASAEAPATDEDDEDDIADDQISISSVEDDDFDWDSDIDGPADDESEVDDEPGMYANDPWNATCVIGLRIYSHCKNASIKVIEHAERPAEGPRQMSK